jgi:hypothetical protein
VAVGPAAARGRAQLLSIGQHPSSSALWPPRTCAKLQLHPFPHALGSGGLSGRFHPQSFDQNRRDIGKSQSKWTASKMKTACWLTIALRRPCSASVSRCSGPGLMD